jgi:hypothetical protein
LRINITLEKAKTKTKSGSKVKTKFDVQIVAIAKVNGADIIYSEDTDIVRLGAEVGIKVVPVADLPTPPPKQQELFGKSEKSPQDDEAEPAQEGTG